MRLPRAVAFGTMHGKEAAFGPPLAALGVALVRPEEIDTDRFGTFTGETPRQGTMLEAARAKALAAMRITGLRHGLASEGAYGPHPGLPFVPLGLEIALWRDEGNGQEVVERLTDEAPAFDHEEVASGAALEPFLTRVRFPETALIVAPAADRTAVIAKGLRCAEAVAGAVRDAIRRDGAGRAFVQTDMRAHMNPRRMEVLGRLAERLAARLARPCPACAAPGWGRMRTEPGLPCGGCGEATALVRHEIHGCAVCGAEERRPRADGLSVADPGGCPVCNP